MARPKKMGTNLADELAIKSVPISEELEKISPFNGVARSVVCYENHGFKNFRIVTLTIQKDVIVKRHVSDCYASFEAIQKLELANDYAQLRLNDKWEDGKAWFLKKDKFDEDIHDGENGGW